MPSPDGCFVQVWDRLDFGGAFDYINGPHNYPSLRDMPGGRVWSNRIRSAKVAAATEMLYPEENGRASSITLRMNAEYARLPDALNGTANSLTILCASGTAASD